ncbi:MAG: sulfotransferase domain-containing protein [Gemmatimonadota bacterium]
MKPTFLILGVGRSGTTSLADNLADHPDVFLSNPKEPWFFDGPRYEERDLDWYWDEYYSEWSGEGAVGEASSHSLFVPHVADRLRADLPDARLMAILRHPVDRAYSHWWMNRYFGMEGLSFDDAVRENLERLERGEDFCGEDGKRRWYDYVTAYQEGELRYRCYVDMGHYAEQIGRYTARFPESHLRVLLLSDLRRDPASTYRELFEFLGVDPEAWKGEAARRNERYESRFVYRITNLATRTRIQYLVPRPVRRWIGGVLRRTGSAPEMSPGARQRLLVHYEPHVRRLEALLDRDLSRWRS